MGHEIVYCVQCATKIPGVDFERGKAFRVGGKVICASCLPSLSLEEQKEASLSSTRMKAMKSSASSQGTSVRIALPRAEAPPSSAAPLAVICGGGGVLALIGILVFMFSGNSRNADPRPLTQPVTVPIAKPPPATAPPPVEKPEENQFPEAQAAVELARAKAKAAPDDLDGQISAWEEAVRKTALTPYFRDASSGLQQARDRRATTKPVAVEKPVVKPPVVPPPTSNPPSPELAAFRTRWDAAMAKASARDFDGAISDLGKAAAELTDEDLRKEARADQEEMGRVRALHTQTQGALSRLSRGQSVTLQVRGPGGEAVPLSGTVVRAGAGRIELRQGDGTAFAEADDTTVASLTRILGEPAAADRRGFAILCLLEGDRESAEQLAATDALAARYWEYAAAATARPPKPSPREIEARNLFYAAERDFGKLDSLPQAILKYKSLAEGFADTRLVKSDLLRIQKRAEAGRDYVFVAGALKGTGTFGLAPAPRTEVAWTSKSDVEAAQSLENFVEVEFAALPDVAYRAWALVGGCCAETFTFYLQTTEGKEYDSKTKQRTPIDPGSGAAGLVKHTISGLKKTHEEHKIKGAKTHPKTPARWEWVSVTLPKYSAPGAKKIRLLTDQQGFSVAAIVVSSSRTAPIGDPELKEEVARVRAAYASQENGLVGWWRFDEGAGATVNDAIEGGHAGTVRGTPRWAAGRIGGALKFESGDLVLIDGGYTFKAVTLSAWVKHDAFSKEVQRYVSLSGETAVIRCEGDRTLHFYIRTNGTLQQMHLPNALEAGKWTHVAGTWDGKFQRVYKDGVLLDTKSPGGSMNGDVQQVLIGHATETLRGAIDEVRVYNRALSEAEIRKQFAEGSQGTIAEIALAPPAPVGKPWRPLFDGTTLSVLKGGQGSWKVENNALVFITGTDDAAQTRENMSDEVRIRFEVKDLQHIWFAFRQGGDGQCYGVRIEDGLKALEGKPHELIIAAKGEQVTATLDGKPVPVASGNAKTGCLQFNARGQTARILSIDVR